MYLLYCIYISGILTPGLIGGIVAGLIAIMCLVVAVQMYYARKQIKRNKLMVDHSGKVGFNKSAKALEESAPLL